jgi:hypothetical protein
MTDESDPHHIYYAALGRLKTGKPLVVSKGTRITNDAVSLEAGRRRGAIKKSRPAFADLIRAIDEAAAEQAAPGKKVMGDLIRSKEDAAGYRSDWEAALARELSLLKEVYELRQHLAQLTGEKVVPIRPR